jgi:hypothetical protein
MRTLEVLACAAITAAALTAAAATQETPFDACAIFTQADAEKALGTEAQPEPVNPKARRPRVVTTCTYTGTKDGKPVAASAQFRFAKTEPEARGAFEDARLQYQTKPLLLAAGIEAFWSAKTGQMHVRKGRTWLTVSVGGAKPAERVLEPAKKLAEILASKI